MSQADLDAAESLDVDAFITRGNALDRGEEVKAPEPPAAEEKPPVEGLGEETKTADELAAADDKERNPDGTFKAERRKDPHKRMIEATAKEATAKRERDEARAENDRLKAENATLRTAPAKPAEEVTPPAKGSSEYKRYQAMTDAPKLAEFVNYEEYTAALSLFIADRRFDERLSEHSEQQAAQHTRSAWFTRLNAAKEKDPELMAALKADTPSTPQMNDFVMHSEIGVDILRHLSDHQDLARRISTLHPLKVAEEMGKLEGQLQARQAAAERPGPAPAPKISQAKPPIKPVDGSPPVSDDVDEGELPVEEFFRRGNDRERTQSRRH